MLTYPLIQERTPTLPPKIYSKPFKTRTTLDGSYMHKCSLPLKLKISSITF